MTNRREFSKNIAVAAALGTQAPFAFSQANTAKIMIGFPPGSTFDAFARRTAERLRGTLASNVIVENKPGAAGQIAIQAIKESAPDGNNILIAPSGPFTIFPHTYKKLPYKTEDFRPVATSVILEPALAVGPAVPENVKTLKDFIEWTKANPKNGNFGTPGVGSMLHMIGSYISHTAKTNWQHVAYRGSPPIMQDMLGGQLPAAVLPVSEFLPFTKDGKVRVLAVSSKERSRFMPEVPTMRQSGIPVSAREWYGFYLPAATPAAVSRRVAAYLQVVLSSPDMVNWANSMSLQMQFRGLDDTESIIKTELEEWRPIIKSIGFTTES